MDNGQEYRCSRCKTEKPAGEFAPSQQTNGGWCRACHRAYYQAKVTAAPPPVACAHCGGAIENPNRKKIFCSPNCKQKALWLRNHPKVVRSCDQCGADITTYRVDARFCGDECATTWRNRNKTPEQRRADKLRSAYGISLEDYDAMVAAQQGRCAICRGDDPRSRHGFWHVDHCHNSNAVRGLLCGPCNTGLGHFKDDVGNLERAIVYLRRAEERCAR